MATQIPDQANKVIRWTDAKVNLVKALKKLGATSATTARTTAEIAKASGGKLELVQVEHQLKPAFDMSVQEMVKRADLETGRAYYVTAKGVKAMEKATAPAPKKAPTPKTRKAEPAAVAVTAQ